MISVTVVQRDNISTDNFICSLQPSLICGLGDTSLWSPTDSRTKIRDHQDLCFKGMQRHERRERIEDGAQLIVSKKLEAANRVQ